jgi:lipoprotein-anchoring transpeptidase ErfK/SrfK
MRNRILIALTALLVAFAIILSFALAGCSHAPEAGKSLRHDEGAARKLTDRHGAESQDKLALGIEDAKTLRTAEATEIPTEVPTEDPTEVPTEVPTEEPTPEPTPKPTKTPKPTATPTPKPTKTPKPTATPTPKPTKTPKPTATPTPKPTKTPKPTATPTPKPTNTPKPTATPTPKPTATPLPYSLYFEKGSATLTIYKRGSNGEYNEVYKTYRAAYHPQKTPVGTFTLGSREKWHYFSGNQEYALYCVTYSSGIYLHGPLYFSKDHNDLDPKYYDGTHPIGGNNTGGCIRMVVEAIKFIYENCPAGTKLVIVNGSPLGTTSPDVPPRNGLMHDPTDPDAAPTP